MANKQWIVTGTDKGFDGLEFRDSEVPALGDSDVLVKMHAASLNFRDIMITRGEYPFPTKFPVVAGSDGAGEVVAVGAAVARWQVGDRVATVFNQHHQDGRLDERALGSGLGGALDGALRRFGAFPETGLVRLPDALSYREGSTLPCAALTAWNALFGLRPLKPGDSVLVQGTGGVSVFALQFAKAAGATVIATTSTPAKAEFLRGLGADHVLNYRQDSEWGETARKLSHGGSGVDVVVDVTCGETLAHSLRAARQGGGVVVVIGFLSGTQPTGFSWVEALGKAAVVRCVYVGSRAMMEDMVAAVEANGIRPALDERVFQLAQAKEAYEYMWSKSHVGKLVIDIE